MHDKAGSMDESLNKPVPLELLQAIDEVPDISFDKLEKILLQDASKQADEVRKRAKYLQVTSVFQIPSSTILICFCRTLMTS
jgi:hypothetical protein